MKINFIYPIAATLIFFASCESHEPETALEENEQQIEAIEDGADNIIEFNDGIVAHIDMGEVQLAKLMDLDAMDASPEEIISSSMEANGDIASRISVLAELKPFGYGGEEFLDAAIQHLTNVLEITNVYSDFASELAIPDEEWTDEMIEKWENLAEPVFSKYEDSYTQLEFAQEEYGALNEMDIIPSDVTIEELYEETK